MKSKQSSLGGRMFLCDTMCIHCLLRYICNVAGRAEDHSDKSVRKEGGGRKRIWKSSKVWAELQTMVKTESMIPITYMCVHYMNGNLYSEYLQQPLKRGQSS